MSAHDPSLLDVWFDRGLDVRARRIVLHGPLEHELEPGKNAVELAAKALLYLDRTPGDIEVWISTPGGLVFEMFALYDVIRTRQNPIRTIGYGVIASAGCLLLAAGDRRAATENAWFMSHEGTSGVDAADLQTIKNRVAAEERMNRRWAALMAKHSRKNAEYWTKVHRGTARELWLDAKQMLSWGVVDEILVETHPA
jgi:ATP-dependent Clp protease protease subunit